MMCRESVQKELRDRKQVSETGALDLAFGKKDVSSHSLRKKKNKRGGIKKGRRKAGP